MSFVETGRMDPQTNADRDVQAHQSSQPAAKPTNPKDLIGVNKVPMSTVSAAVLAEVGVAMLEGAAKYGRHNYRADGVRASIYYDATMRHLMGWWEGEDIDPGSGLHHVTKAISSLVVLRDAMIQGAYTDDRPPRSVAFYERLNAACETIRQRYQHLNPHHYTLNDIPTMEGHNDENTNGS